MEQSKDFEVKEKENNGCKLKKNLYGLKQAPCNGIGSLVLS